ncbi:MAG: hypothetical protein QOF89_4483 [Acidobacteriota bacterium]|jgi:hypothetical protein|nr:hypothetical protein [Acidobacteriota bacterium]
MIHAGWSRGSRSSGVEPPIELRFVDLFMILVTTLIFITVILSIVSAFVGKGGRSEPLVRVQPSPGGADEHRLPRRVEPTAGALATERQARPQIVAPRILLPDARAETAYQFELRMNGGSPPFRWQLAGGKLPRGLRLSPDGAVLGVPQGKEGMSEFSVRVVDTARRRWTQPLALRIAPAPPSLTWKILQWAFWIWVVVSFLGSLPTIWKGGVLIGLEQFFRQRSQREGDL